MRNLIVLALVVAACGNDESVPPADSTTGSIDAAIDATASNSVVCDEPTMTCPVPAQVCCDVMTGMDVCVATGGSCTGRPLACDGPEDCPVTQECCLWSDRSECLDIGICGTTGSITEVMCHADTDCDMTAGESCCGTAPGPVIDLYSVCRTGACPQ